MNETGIVMFGVLVGWLIGMAVGMAVSIWVDVLIIARRNRAARDDWNQWQKEQRHPDPRKGGEEIKGY